MQSVLLGLQADGRCGLLQKDAHLPLKLLHGLQGGGAGRQLGKLDDRHGK